MRFIRYENGQGGSYGAVDRDGQVRAVSGSIYDNPHFGEVVGTLESVSLLAPCEPTKILCIGSNYRSAVLTRGRELPKAPVAFLKTPNSVIGPDADIIRPVGVETFAYEGEMTVIIGKTATAVPTDRAFDYIFGYTIGNDVTVRDWQQTDQHWTRAKASDTFCPLGPWIETEVNPTGLALQVRINGQLQQDGRTNDLIFTIPEIIEYLTRTMTLVPGDAILTGTPLGAEPIVDGDVIEIAVEGIGTLRNTVRQAS